MIDNNELMAEAAKSIQSDKLYYFVSSFEDFNFPKNEYDIASAMYSLPFNPPSTFDTVFKSVKQSIVKGSIFCGQLFGSRDEWKDDPKKTFHTEKEVENLLKDMEIIYFNEEENDSTTANGTPKHWHIFHFISRKK